MHACPSFELSTLSDSGHQWETHVLVAVARFIVLAMGLVHGGLHVSTSQPFHVHTPPSTVLPHTFKVLTHRCPSFLTYRVFITGGLGGHTGSAHSVLSHQVRTQFLSSLSLVPHWLQVDTQRLPFWKTIMVFVGMRGGQQVVTSFQIHLPAAASRPVTNHLLMHCSPLSLVIFITLGLGLGPGLVAVATVAAAATAAATANREKRPMVKGGSGGEAAGVVEVDAVLVGCGLQGGRGRTKRQAKHTRARKVGVYSKVTRTEGCGHAGNVRVADESGSRCGGGSGGCVCTVPAGALTRLRPRRPRFLLFPTLAGLGPKRRGHPPPRRPHQNPTRCREGRSRTPGPLAMRAGNVSTDYLPPATAPLGSRGGGACVNATPPPPLHAAGNPPPPPRAHASCSRGGPLSPWEVTTGGAVGRKRGLGCRSRGGGAPGSCLAWLCVPTLPPPQPSH